MNIYHVAVLGSKVVPAFTDLSISETNVTDSGIIQSAIEKAIQNTIIIPFQDWCINMWSGFMSLSYYACLFTAMGGVICWICGIEKGKSIATIAILVYVGLQLVNWIILG